MNDIICQCGSTEEPESNEWDDFPWDEDEFVDDGDLVHSYDDECEDCEGPCEYADWW